MRRTPPPAARRPPTSVARLRSPHPGRPAALDGAGRLRRAHAGGGRTGPDARPARGDLRRRGRGHRGPARRAGHRPRRQRHPRPGTVRLPRHRGGTAGRRSAASPSTPTDATSTRPGAARLGLDPARGARSALLRPLLRRPAHQQPRRFRASCSASSGPAATPRAGSPPGSSRATWWRSRASTSSSSCTRTSPPTARRSTAAVRAAIRGQDGPTGLAVPPRGRPATLPSLAAALPRRHGAARRDTEDLRRAARARRRGARRCPGRKNLLLYSIGFGDVDRSGPTDRAATGATTRFYPPMMRALNGANVAVYGVDLAPPGARNELAGLAQRPRGRHRGPPLLQPAGLPAARSRRSRARPTATT